MFDIYSGNNFPAPWKTVARLFEPLLLKDARKVFTISDDFADHFIKKFGKKEKHCTIPVCLDEKRYAETLAVGNIGKAKKPERTIVFTGSIYWAQQKSLSNMIEAVDSMANSDIKFKIYTPTTSKDIGLLLSHNNSLLRTTIETLSPDQIPIAQSQADILFLPLSWNTDGDPVISTAVPFKIVEYMISGRPILIHAPADSYLVKYAKKEGFALIIDKENIEELQTGIIKLLNDKKYAKKLSDAAKSTFFKNHQASANALKLASMIDSI